MVEPYKYIIYNPIREGEFAAISKESFNRKFQMACKSKKEKKVKKIHHKKPKLSCNLLDKVDKIDNIPLTLDKPLTYTFSKTPRSLPFGSQMSVNDKRFDFNPRSTDPDPYYLTHKKYYHS